MTTSMGIDACRAGWFAIIKQEGSWDYYLTETLNALLGEFTSNNRIYIDIPIGLPEAGKRQCDQLARRLLSPYRHSSVFPVPVREAVYATDYATACRINARQTGSKITRQTWNICPKIREVDSYLRQHPAWQQCLHESHPEVAFYALNDQQPLQTRKKSLEGGEQRLALLKPYIDDARALYANCLDNYARGELQPDDILDAMALAVMADKAAQHVDGIITLPPTPRRDRYGLPMQIVYQAQNT